MLELTNILVVHQLVKADLIHQFLLLSFQIPGVFFFLLFLRRRLLQYILPLLIFHLVIELVDASESSFAKELKFLVIFKFDVTILLLTVLIALVANYLLLYHLILYCLGYFFALKMELLLLELLLLLRDLLIRHRNVV